MTISRVANVADSALQFLERLSFYVGYVALWSIVALVFFQVFTRQLLQMGLPWPEELARFLHIALVFLSLAHVLRDDGHLKVEMFLDRTPQWFQRGSKILFLVAMAAAAGFIAYGGVVLIDRLGHTRTQALRMPLSLFFLPTLVGFTAFMLECVSKAVRLLRGPVRRSAIAADPEAEGSR